MKNNLLKRMLRFYYRNNSIHHIILGPMAGMQFRVNNVTKLAPIYSGNERWHQKRFKELLKKGSVLIDVGANWGLHTLYTSRLVGKTGKVIAIEPFPPAFKELEWHIAKNNCKNVIALNMAVGEFNGQVNMASSYESSQGVILKSCEKDNLAKDEYLVNQKKLDIIVQELELDRVDLIKVDVEGAEDHVLQGADQVIQKFRPIFIIDAHTSENDLFIGAWFIERGYRLERVNKKLPPIMKTGEGYPGLGSVWDTILAIPQI